MARPLKSGVDYWPFDVGFFRDKKIKLIKGEFGVKGVYIALNIINQIYEENGYYKSWDEDDCFLMSEGVGDGCSPEMIDEVVHGCLRRSLFDKRVFEMFGVLTSEGIQRRFVKAVQNSRPDIQVIAEFWLLEQPLNKVTFKSVNLTENPVNLTENPSKPYEKPPKVKNNKVKDNKEYISDFENLWTMYPKKVGRKEAFGAYCQAIEDGVKHEKILSGLENYLAWIKKEKIEMRYIKNGSTFFMAESWNDKLTFQSKESSYDLKAYEEEVKTAPLEYRRTT